MKTKQKCVLVLLIVVFAIVLCGCGIISTCDSCGKTFFGKGYYEAFNPKRTLCEDCAKEYYAPFPYASYAN